MTLQNRIIRNLQAGNNSINVVISSSFLFPKLKQHHVSLEFISESFSTVLENRYQLGVTKTISYTPSNSVTYLVRVLTHSY